MSFTDVCDDFACGVGKCIGGVRRAFGSTGQAVSESLQKLRPRLRREKIRSIIIEELTRLVGKEAELEGAKLEERLQAMAETILALQERVNELSVRGPVSEADMWKEIGSLEAAAPLSNDERAILVNILRQNIALQKPHLVDVPLEGSTPE